MTTVRTTLTEPAVRARTARPERLPFVSVVVPAYNAAPTIAACLESLCALDYPSDRCEIIVADNGSTDGTAAIARRYPVRVVEERRRRSAYAARNTGIEASRGEWIAFTDADCIVQPPWLTRLVEGWQEETVGALAGRVVAATPRTVVEQFAAARRQVSQDVSLSCSFLPYAITANVAYRREILRVLGGFDEAFVSGGDADLSWRLQLACGKTIHFNPRALVVHRHRDSLRGFMRQHWVYGYGTAMLYERFAGYRKSLAAEAWGCLRRTSWFLVRGASRLLRAPLRRRGDRLFLAEHFLEALCTSSRFAGLATYAWHRATRRREPVS